MCMKKVLHICNSYMRSKVHVELYKRLDSLGLSQIIYSPEREEFDFDNSFESKSTTIICSKVIKKYHSYAFRLKTVAILRDLEKKVKVNSIDCIHATTLFSDGVIAYKLSRKYGIPYIVAVRNTDVNVFLKMAPHLWGVMRKILLDASRVVFISPSIQDKLLSHCSIKDIKDRIEHKCIIQPNGIDSFWLEHICENRKHSGHEVVYVGRFMANKNLKVLIDSITELKTEIPDIKLNLVGGGGELEEEIKQLAIKHRDVITFWGRIDDKNKLLEVYRKSDVFAMISKTETFGLVYIEALTQRCPVLYTKGQGIDGLFKENVGEGVDPMNIEDVKNKLKSLLQHTNEYYSLSDSDFSSFNWNVIAMRYYQLYSSI